MDLLKSTSLEAYHHVDPDGRVMCVFVPQVADVGCVNIRYNSVKNFPLSDVRVKPCSPTTVGAAEYEYSVLEHNWSSGYQSS